MLRKIIDERQRADQDPLRSLSAQIDLILSMVGEQLGEEHGLNCPDGGAQRRQELKLKVIQQPLHKHESRESGLPDRLNQYCKYAKWSE